MKSAVPMITEAKITNAPIEKPSCAQIEPLESSGCPAIK